MAKKSDTVEVKVTVPRAKKAAKKKSTKKKTTKSKVAKKGTIDKQILANLVELQKVHINLAEKFDNLSKQISSLLGLFETTAKSFASAPGMATSAKDVEFLDKIDKLLEQNKTIAKALTMMDEKVRGRAGEESVLAQQEPRPEAPSEQPFRPPASGRPLPKF